MENLDTKKLIIGIVLLCLLIIGGSLVYAFTSGKIPGAQPTPSATQTPVQTQTYSTPVIPDPPVFSGKQVINLTKSGFDPATIRIKKGTLIQWINQSGTAASVNSANHPTHQVYPSLNLGKFPDGAGVSLIFNDSGTYKYHNHLNPSQTGTVVVE